MENSKDKIYWHVYEHDDVLKIWRGNTLLAEIPSDEFPHMILQMAKHLKNNVAREK